MANYNDLVVPKIAEYLERFVAAINRYDSQSRIVTLKSYNMMGTDESDLGTLIKGESTAYFECEFIFETKNAEGDILATSECLMKIPRMINGVFVIRGKLREPTYTLTNAWDCRVYKDSVAINSKVRIEYQSRDLYEVTITDELGEQYVFNRVEFINYLESNRELDYLLELSDYEISKLKLKLDTDNVPKSVTPELIESLIDLGEDKYNDSIVDKKVSDTLSSLLLTLNLRETKRKLRKNFWDNYNKNNGVYLTKLQNIIFKFFNVADRSDIDIPQNINPLTYSSLEYKIIFPSYTTFNKSMAEIIDPVDTPENNNVNRINRLNVCSSISDGIIFIDCYSLTGNKIHLRYVDYLNKHRLSNSDYDYETKSVIKRDSYIIKKRFNEEVVSDLSLLSDLVVEPKPDEMLSINSRRIPLINMSDSGRVAMGTGMENQAVEVEASEPALMISGNDEDVDNNVLITYFDGPNSEVTKIEDGKIYLRDVETSSTSFIEISEPTEGMSGSIISFVPNVKPGDVISKGTKIIVPKMISRGTYELGANAFCFYMNYLGYTHEDGIVISKSFANKMTIYTPIEVRKSFKLKDKISSIVPIGQKIQSGDYLVEASRETTEKIPKAFIAKSDLTNQIDLIVPANIDEGYVVDVKVQYKANNLKDYNRDEGNVLTYKTINDFITAKEVKDDYLKLPEKFRILKAKEGDFINDAEFIITYKLVVVRPLIIGSKLTNRYGSKGEVSLILPDELMPRLDEDGKGNGTPAEILLNPAAVIARKNPSQLFEALLTKIIKVIYNKVGEFLANNEIDQAKNELKALYKDKFDNLSEDELRDTWNQGITAFNVAVGSYSKMSLTELFNLAKIYGVSELQDIYAPDVTISTDKRITGYDPNKVPEGLTSLKTYELGFIEQPVVTGWTYIMRLHHSADYVGKVTPEIARGDEPIMNRGIYRSSGQVISEMELWALMSHGTTELVSQDFDKRLDPQLQFLNDLLLAGIAMVDSEGMPLMSEYRKKIQKLRDSAKIKKLK
jgi:hypothetical protein